MSEPERHGWVAPETANGARLDVHVGETLKLSRTRLKALFEEDCVRVNGRKVKKGDKVQTGQRIDVELREAIAEVEPVRAEISLELLHEDSEVVVVNKPAGTPSQPLRPGETGTVASALIARFPQCEQASEDPREGGLCHRLDIETSGALLAAKNRAAWTALRTGFTERRIEKKYWALVTGPIGDDGEIELPLRHHPRHPDRVEPAMDGSGREALSSFRVLSRAGEYSLVEVSISTGVLHQVRAHLAAIGAPLVGDTLYGGREEPELSRFFLHARSIGFRHPVTAEQISVEAPLPAALTASLARHGVSAVNAAAPLTRPTPQSL